MAFEELLRVEAFVIVSWSLATRISPALFRGDPQLGRRSDFLRFVKARARGRIVCADSV